MSNDTIVFLALLNFNFIFDEVPTIPQYLLKSRMYKFILFFLHQFLKLDTLLYHLDVVVICAIHFISLSWLDPDLFLFFQTAVNEIAFILQKNNRNLSFYIDVFGHF